MVKVSNVDISANEKKAFFNNLTAAVAEINRAKGSLIAEFAYITRHKTIKNRCLLNSLDI